MYIDNVKTQLNFEDFLKTLNKTNVVFWVYDDETFYCLLLSLDKFRQKIKVNIYNFEIIGFSYKNFIFKQIKLKVIENKINLHNKFVFSYGSYALNIVKELIDKNKIQKTFITDSVKVKIRKAYSGGRNEFISEPVMTENLYSIDYNKMYYTCLKSEYLCGKITKVLVDSIEKPGFYFIKYESNGFCYPILSYKNEINSQNYFCNGISEGLFWYEEILLFINEGGKIKKIYYAYYGEKYICNFLPFTDLIDLYKETKLTKNLANNLYGKLAMKDFFYTYRLLSYEEFILETEKNKIYKWKKWYNYYICENIEYTKYNNYTDICAAAAITSKARIKLYNLIKELDSKSKICLLNTDEIIYNSKNEVLLPKKYDIKTKKITFEEFNIKKSMFLHKRKHIENNHTVPFKIIDNMLF